MQIDLYGKKIEIGFVDFDARDTWFFQFWQVTFRIVVMNDNYRVDERAWLKLMT